VSVSVIRSKYPDFISWSQTNAIWPGLIPLVSE
jgi:hypothetical protein